MLYVFELRLDIKYYLNNKYSISFIFILNISNTKKTTKIKILYQHFSTNFFSKNATQRRIIKDLRKILFSFGCIFKRFSVQHFENDWQRRIFHSFFLLHKESGSIEKNSSGHKSYETYRI